MLRLQFLDEVDRLFVPREILIRTDGRVRYITISRRRQLMAAGAAVAFLGWVLLSSAGVLVTAHLVNKRGEEARQADAAYESLRAQVLGSGARFASLAQQLDAHQQEMLDAAGFGSEPRPSPPQTPLATAGPAADPVAALLDSVNASLRRLGENDRLIAREMAAINAALAEAGDSRAHAARARDRFAGRWRGSQAKLRRAQAANGALNDRIDLLEAQLASLRALQARNAAERAALAARVADLTGALAAAGQENKRLSAAVTGMRRTVASLANDRSSLRAARDTMAAQAARLGTGLAAAEQDKKRLARAVTGMQRTTASLANDRSNLRAARDEIASKLSGLEARLAAIQSTQRRVVQKLTERARVNVDEVEKTVAMTGLDVERLLGAAAKELAGAGGPFIAAPRFYRSPDELRILANVDKLGGQVDRLERLQFVLRTLPLASPLDSYTLASGFGTRPDPINSKRAVHEGVDLKNRQGTPVLSTAPGKVVYAGWMGEYGRLVEIDHGLGIRTRYAHLKAIEVKVGEEVSYRQEIGKVGHSGRATGPHVHYEVRVNGKPYDPMNFLEAGKYVFKG